MTTVAWDGRVLAADSRRTHRVERTDGVVKIRIYAEGKMLVKKPTSSAKKKKDAPIPEEKPESILAIAGAGNAELIRRVIAQIEHNGWTYVAWHGSRWNFAVRGMKDAQVGARARLLAISKTHVHSMVVTSCGVEDVSENKRSEKIAIGSGAKVAEFLMGQFDLTAQEAVAGAALTDRGTGGHVQAVSLVRNKAVMQPDILLDDINACRRGLQKAIKRCVVPRTKRLFDRHVIVDLS